MNAFVIAGRELRAAFNLTIAYTVLIAFLLLDGAYLFIIHPF